MPKNIFYWEGVNSGRVVTDTGSKRKRTPVYRETIDRFWILRLVIEVRDDDVAVQLSPFQRSFHHILFRKIEDVCVAIYLSMTYDG